tara:strand:- start:345 stop:1301 length:957 start_codon:yes stop_codon:yes gene_type:complete
MNSKITLLIISALISFSTYSSPSDAEFTIGFTLYNQNDWINSQEPLRTSAEAGNSDAQYYLAEAIRLSSRYTTEESQKWYEAAAEQGDLYAMIRLGSTDDLCGSLQKECKKDRKYWTEKVRKQAKIRANSGDKDAMEVMYYLSGDRKWLEKSSELGNSNASYLMAKQLLSDTRDSDTGKTVLSPKAEFFLRKAAENENPGAMALLSSKLEREKKFGESKKWLERCLLTSHADCVLRLENIHRQLTDRYKNLDYQPSKTIAYGILLFRRDALGKAKTTWILDTFEDELTAEQKAEGEKFFHEWKKTHPPLSFHVPKLGF